MGHSESKKEWMIFGVGMEIKREDSECGKGSETLNGWGCRVRDSLAIRRS